MKQRSYIDVSPYSPSPSSNKPNPLPKISKLNLATSRVWGSTARQDNVGGKLSSSPRDGAHQGVWFQTPRSNQLDSGGRPRETACATRVDGKGGTLAGKMDHRIWIDKTRGAHGFLETAVQVTAWDSYHPVRNHPPDPADNIVLRVRRMERFSGVSVESDTIPCPSVLKQAICLCKDEGVSDLSRSMIRSQSNPRKRTEALPRTLSMPIGGPLAFNPCLCLLSCDHPWTVRSPVIGVVGWSPRS